jgi:hypothetical protein
MASLEPTSTAVGNTNSTDDSAEAVNQLREMAEKQGRCFETVFSDPANAKLANKRLSPPIPRIRRAATTRVGLSGFRKPI